MKQRKVVAYTYLILGIILCLVFAGRFLPFNSYGAEDVKMTIGNQLNKYINYYVSEEDKGTLVQYKMNTKVEYGKEVLPISQKEIIVNLSQIEGKYPDRVKVMNQDCNIEVMNQYDASKGRLLIQGDSEKQQEDYLVMAYYDTYTEENMERELESKVEAKAILAEEENRPIVTEEQYNDTVTENIGQLTSIDSKVQDIFNGYIKSNVINGTNYTTQYSQNEQIVVSKKEEQDTIEMLIKDTFVRVENKGEEEFITDLGNNQKLVYKNTQIRKSEIEKLLGKQGTLEILDQEGNNITTIDENTPFNEEGMAIIEYENEPEAIIIKTSKIQEEGILNLKHTKEIKNTMTDFQNVSVKTTIQLNGKEEIPETICPIKEAKTTIDVNMSHTNWSNKQQNEITFDIYLKANTIENNMFKNPSIQIEFPSQVEKVILGDSSIMYANGLALQNPTIATNEKGNLVMTVNLSGEQTQYDENSLALITNIKIATNVILKKEIESTEEAIHLSYCNQYTIDGSIETGEKEIPIEMENYQEETVEEANNPVFDSDIPQPLTENNDTVKLEVAPTKGETTLKEGDTVYEGEYIKYNIRVTNTSQEDIHNVTVVASIPEGVTYGELEADYNNYLGKYKYNFQENLREKQIHMGTIKAGGYIDTFYEVRVNDLPEEKENQSIDTDMNVFVEDQFAQSYSITNQVEPSEVQLFMGASLDYGGWTYYLNLKSETDKEVSVNMHLPEAFKIRVISYLNRNIDAYTGFLPFEGDVSDDVYTSDDDNTREPIRKLELEFSDNNIIKTKLKTNSCYLIKGKIDETKIKKNDTSKVELSSYVEAILNENYYRSNENRIEHAYQNVKVSMTSPNEGEKVKYGDKINYEITIQNIGGNNTIQNNSLEFIGINVSDYLPDELEPVSITYDNWEWQEAGTDNESTFKKKEVTQSISGKYTDENGNRMPEVRNYIILPRGETVTVKIETKAGSVDKETKIENSATISGERIDVKTTNVISHTILPEDYEEEDPNNPNQPDDPNRPNDPDQPDDPNQPDDPTNSEDNYKIAGIVWIDDNEDGKRTSEEEIVSQMTVMLIDTDNAREIKNTTKTNDKGEYEFSNLKQGNYLVVFRYDTNTYKITEYQKSGVSSSVNSDATNKTIILPEGQVDVGITDTIKLNRSFDNIDMGLIENKICDFKIEKYINKVTVKTKKGIKEYNYGNKKLVKTEIKAKEIEGATVTIEYKMVITNVGEIAGTINQIVDYLPNELTFSSDQNSSWAKGTNGELINTSVANKNIQVGESLDLKLIATKQMTADSTGTFTNKVNIIEKTDSNSDNNSDGADIIISVSTGAILLITMMILIIVILSLIAIYLGKKGKINIKKFIKRTFVFTFMATMLISSSYDRSIASDKDLPEFPPELRIYCVGVYKPAEQGGGFYFIKEGVKIDPNDIEGIKKKSVAHCIIAEKLPPGGEVKADDEVNEEEKPKELGNDVVQYKVVTYKCVRYGFISDKILQGDPIKEGDFDLNKENTTIKMKNLNDNYYIYGPFKYTSTASNGTYTCTVKDNANNNITDFTICNERGEEQSRALKGGTQAFYIKIAKNKCSNGVKTVNLEVKATGTEKQKWIKKATAVYQGEGNPDYSNEEMYQKIETDNDEEDYFIGCYKDLEGVDSKPFQKTLDITWTDIPGMLKIIKVDKDNTNIKLPGVKFTIQDKDEKYLVIKDKNGDTIKQVTGKYIVGQNDTKLIKTENESSTLTKFVTDDNGEILIEGLEKGKYSIIEEENPNYGYEKNSDSWEQKEVKGGTLAILTMKNEKTTGNLKIEKIDANSKEPLSGVSFVIKNSNGKYLKLKNDSGKEQDKIEKRFHVGSIVEKEKEKEATELITDVTGCIEIYNLPVDTYTVIETSVGDNEDNGYEVDDDYISWSSNVNKNGKGRKCKVEVTKRQASETEMSKNKIKADVLTVKNKRKYINLSGYVWEDLPWQEGKETKWNDLYKGNEKDKNDKRLKGIEVQLIDSTGEQKAKDTTTNEKGKYQFKKVEIDKLKDYYIEFKYNGMSYQNIAVNMEEEKGNKASEGDNREEFNQGYQTITKGKSNGHKSISYERLPYESKLLYGKKANYNYGYEGDEENRDPVSGVDAQYTIKANTKKLNNMRLPLAYGSSSTTGSTTDKVSDDIPDSIKDLIGNSTNKQEKEEANKETEKKQSELLKATPANIRGNGIKEIQNINLGIRKRDKIDLEVIKDIHSIRISINGATHVYKYADRFNNAIYEEYHDDKIKSGYDISPKIKYQKTDRYGNMSYTRAVYESDVYYENAKEPDKNLKMEVTYQIGIRNNTAEGIRTTINEFTDYYDSKYKEILKIGKKVNEDGTVQEDEKTKVTKIEKKGDYQKATIETNLGVTAQKQSNLYVQLQIEPTKIIEIVKQKTKLDNIVEISSYSSKRKNENNDYDIYAAIDIDSEPGNLEIDDIKSYEDDTDKAPGLGIVFPEERKIKGIVFKDKTEKEDEVIQGEIRQGDGIYKQEEEYGIDGVTVKLVKANNIDETAKGFNPETKNFEDITTTTQNGGVFELSGFIPDNYQVVYTWGDSTYKVQEYKSTIVDKKIYESKGTSNLEWYKEEFKKNTIKEGENSIPEWNQDSNQEIRVSDAVDIYEEREAIDQQSNIMTYGNKTVINNYEGELKQENETTEGIIKKIKAVTPTFKVNVEYFDTLPENKKEEYELVNGEIQIDESGYVKKAKGYQHILKNIDFGIVKRAQQVLRLDKDIKRAKITLANGVVLINAEIKDGKIVDQVKHATYIPATAANKGQVKFEVDKELLQGAQLEIGFGLKVSNISELDYKNEAYYKYGKGQGEKENELVQLDPQQVIDYLDNSISIGTDNQLGEIRQEQGKKDELITNGLLEDTSAMRQLLKDTQRVLIIQKLEGMLKPMQKGETTQGRSTSIDQELKASRLLSSTALDEGIDMGNIAEIIKIKKTWGAPVKTIPGNYTPSASHELDDSTSETVTVVPPTGLDINYIAYTLLAISSLGILVSGIILIKKFVLK